MADATPSVSVRNGGTRRVILGPPPRSGLRPVLLGTADDARGKAKNPQGNFPDEAVRLDGAMAAAWKGSKVLEAAKEHLGLQVK